MDAVPEQRGGNIHTAQQEAQRQRLHSPAVRLHGHACQEAQVRVTGGINKAPAPDAFRTVFADNGNCRDFSVFCFTAAEVGIGKQFHMVFQRHALENQLQILRMDGHMPFGVFHLGSAHGFQPLHQFPGNAAHHPAFLVKKTADGYYQPRRRSAAQESEPLHNGRAAAAPGC